MKKSIFAVSLFVAGLAFAGTTTITNDYIIGVMPVSITNTQVILSVPWVQPGGGDAIAVSNFVKTAGLTDNDTLTWYDGSAKKYNIWSLDATSAGTNYWQSVPTVEENSIYAVDPANAVLKQGNAVVLNRASSNETVYVIGQVGTNSTITTTIAASAVSLIAPPGSLNGVFDVNKDITYVDGEPEASVCDLDKNRISSVGDLLIRENVGGLTVSFIYYKAPEGDKGYWRPSYDISETRVVVPAGCGIWYKRKADTTMTIEWSAMAVGN